MVSEVKENKNRNENSYFLGINSQKAKIVNFIIGHCIATHCNTLQYNDQISSENHTKWQTYGKT